MAEDAECIRGLSALADYPLGWTMCVMCHAQGPEYGQWREIHIDLDAHIQGIGWKKPYYLFWNGRSWGEYHELTEARRGNRS